MRWVFVSERKQQRRILRLLPYCAPALRWKEGGMPSYCLGRESKWWAPQERKPRSSTHSPRNRQVGWATQNRPANSLGLQCYGVACSQLFHPQLILSTTELKQASTGDRLVPWDTIWVCLCPLLCLHELCTHAVCAQCTLWNLRTHSPLPVLIGRSVNHTINFSASSKNHT